MPAEEDEADRMQSELDELDERIDDARKKSQHTREQSDLDDEELGTGEVVGDFSDTATTDDDPSGALDETSEKGH